MVYSRIVTILQMCLLIPFHCWAKESDEKTTTWQISKGLDWANHQYTDIPVYNSNGSMALFFDEDRKYFVSRSLDAAPVRVAFAKTPKGKVEWDRNRPEIIYYLSLEPPGSCIRRYNFITGREDIIYSTEHKLSEIAPPHPDGEHLLMAMRETENTILILYSLFTGKTKKIPMDVAMHRVRFTQAPDLSVYINRSERPKTSWLVDVHSGEKREIYKGASTSPNWRYGGQNFCFYGYHNGTRGLLVLDRNGQVVKIFPELTNHHLCWSRDGRYIATDTEANKDGKYPGYICVVDYEAGKVIPIVKHESNFDDKDEEKFSPGHPHPQLSPDATKVVYNSTKFGYDHPHVFVSLVREPDPVENVSLTPSTDSLVVSWAEPKGLEIERCLVYRIDRQGKSELAGTVDLPDTRFVDYKDNDATEYHIIAQEFSGSKSRPAVIKKD